MEDMGFPEVEQYYVPPYVCTKFERRHKPPLECMRSVPPHLSPLRRLMRRRWNSPVHGTLGVAGQLEDVARRRVVQDAADVGVVIHATGAIPPGPAAHVRVPLAGTEAGGMRLQHAYERCA